MDSEKEQLILNPEVQCMYELALQMKKKVIFISDMYFSEHFIVELLQKRGIKQFEKVFVSSEYQQTKKSGNLYKIVKQELKVKLGVIIHIGDNSQSDYQMALEKGMGAILY